MPKMKTHRGLAKRTKVTGTGKITRHKAFKSHILNKKTAKRKRNLRKGCLIADANKKQVKRMLGM